MPTRRVTLLLVTTATSIGLVFGAMQGAQAKSLVGTKCAKIGAATGNGPGKSVVCKKKSKRNQGKAPSTQTSSTTPTDPIPQDCTKLPEFTADFIDPMYVRDVTPIGEQTGTGGVIAVRSYIHPKSEFLEKELPIYAPVNMTLNSANYYKVSGASANYQPEYSLYFDAGCGISVKFFHIKGKEVSMASETWCAWKRPYSGNHMWRGYRRIVGNSRRNVVYQPRHAN